MILGAAIQSRRQNARYRRLPDPAVPAKDVPVRRASLLDPILQGASYVLLSDDFGFQLCGSSSTGTKPSQP